MSRPETATVFDVQRFSIHDGPGIRTVIFFKGCSLDCLWCQNPEAVRMGPQIAYSADRCVAGCARCLAACPEKALCSRQEERIDFSRCTDCGLCVAACPSDALRMIGRETTVPDLLEEVLRDRSFYQTSEGGITLSGGEPVLQAVFLREFLPRVKEQGLDVSLETAGFYPFGLLDPVLPFVDLVLYDLKVIGSRRHQRLTCHRNDLVLSNLARLLETGVRLELRMPVIPALNTDGENVRDTAALLDRLGVSELTLLPYNHLWEAKLPRMDTDHRPLGLRPPEDASYQELCDEFARHGVTARL